MYYVEYEPNSFIHLFESLRSGTTQVNELVNLEITRHLLGFNTTIKWHPNYMQRDTVKDTLITIKLIADQKEYKILYSTLCRFPNSKWAKEALTSTYIEVDLNVDIFNWIFDLYRGINTPLTLPSNIY